MTDDHGIHPETGPAAAVDWSIRHVAETGSTNADLLALVDAVDDVGALRPVVLRTDHQTAGRGRLDRRWDAPPGSNLLVSFLVPDPPAAPQVVVQAIALAALGAVDEVVGEGRAALKWPNDLLLDGRKLAGVLAQRHSAGPVVVGVGLNVGWAPDGAARLADLADDAEEPIPTPAEFLDRLVDRLRALAPSGRFEASRITPLVRERLATLGAEVRIELPGDRIVTGRAVELGDDGRLGLLVARGDAAESDDRDDPVAWFDVGDVVHLRSVDRPPT